MNRNSGNGGHAHPPCGVLLVDKPVGMSSHDVVDEVRRGTGIRKVGHGGTLDPFATGLLLVLVGRATRLFDFFVPLAKEYVVTMQVGARSSTGDSDGDITPVPGEVSESALREVLGRFRGTIEQRVPAYSAVKVGGERLYRKARRGEEVTAPAREVTVHELDLESFDHGARTARLRVVCSKGTYIRSLCEDIGAAAGTAAYAAGLRRTAIGDFRVENATSLDRLAAGGAAFGGPPGADPSFISCLGALYFLPVRVIAESEIKAVANGRSIPGEASGPVRVAYDERLLAVYGPGEESGYMVPMVVFS